MLLGFLKIKILKYHFAAIISVRQLSFKIRKGITQRGVETQFELTVGRNFTNFVYFLVFNNFQFFIHLLLAVVSVYSILNFLRN